MEKINTKSFIARCNSIHEFKYDYSLTVYTQMRDKISIICEEHGLFQQSARHHVSGTGCPKCKYKNIVESRRTDISQVEVPENASIIPLTKGKYTIIDSEDYGRVKSYTWILCNENYCYSTEVGKLHRFIKGVTDPKILIDHINHNGLDNRKDNLRESTFQQNCYNFKPKLGGASKYKGVTKSHNKWAAKIRHNNKGFYLGRFDTEEEAAVVYDAKAKELFGEFAYINLPNQK